MAFKYLEQEDARKKHKLKSPKVKFPISDHRCSHLLNQRNWAQPRLWGWPLLLVGFHFIFQKTILFRFIFRDVRCTKLSGGGFLHLLGGWAPLLSWNPKPLAHYFSDILHQLSLVILTVKSEVLWKWDIHTWKFTFKENSLESTHDILFLSSRSISAIAKLIPENCICALVHYIWHAVSGTLYLANYIWYTVSSTSYLVHYVWQTIPCILHLVHFILLWFNLRYFWHSHCVSISIRLSQNRFFGFFCGA